MVCFSMFFVGLGEGGLVTNVVLLKLLVVMKVVEYRIS